MAITITTTLSDTSVLLSVEGRLVEHTSNLETVQINPELDLQIDLNGLQLINSIGVRNFHNWSFAVECKSLTLLNCPPVFVHQLNLVFKFLPAKTQIESFFVPYYSEVANEEKKVLFRKYFEFEKVAGEVRFKYPNVLDSTGKPMELDVGNDQYFDFLNLYN